MTDWLHGRPLTNGATFTVKGLLGVNAKISEDIDAGMELMAFTSQGNQVIDAFWGVSAPYQNNVFTSTSSTGVGPGAAGLQPLNNAPFTRMVLDNFWVKHKPSGTQLIVGSFGKTRYDSLVYAMQPNPTVGGPPNLNSFGVQVTGSHQLGEDEKSPRLSYEVMGTRLADGNIDLVTGGSASYFSHAEGANIAIHFDEDRGVGRLNWLHAANDASGGAPLAVGLTQLPNLVSGWVNPQGFYTNQLATTNLGGIGSTSDKRPVPMAGATDGITGIPGTLNVGGIGPQDQTSYGLSLHYNFDNEYKPKVFGEFAHSDYKPQKNSSYGVGGNAFRLGAGASFFDDQVDVDLHYLRVDPTYDPFILQIPTIGGISTPLWRIPDLNQFWNLYSLHDTAAMPHNRQGLRGTISWKFNPNGKLSFNYGNLTQVRSSMQDVRFSANSLAPGTPNTNVLGYSPGFMDPVFLGFAPQTFAASGTNALALPLEDPKGTMEHFLVSGSHKWKFDDKAEQGVTLSGLFLNYNYRRNSNLASLLPGPLGIRGESQNRVDFTIQGWNLGVGYDVTEDFAVRAAYTQLNVFGHIDPLGVYSNFAQASNSSSFNTWDITQSIPEIGFDWKLSEKSSWGLTAKLYNETDHIPANVLASPTLPSLNVAMAPQNAHPFSYSGIQVMSTYSLRF
ncbi:TonB-dependent receptor [bacterium]|nr:TonB-dependent receptor [bacterium]